MKFRVMSAKSKMIKNFKRLAELSPLRIYYYLIGNNKEIKKEFQSGKIIEEYIRNHKIKKMQIGCGDNFLKGWLNTDIVTNNGATYLDAAKKFNIHSDSFHYIFSEHLFEHLNVQQQLNFLEESYRVLKDRGILRIATPSLDFLFDIYREPDGSINDNYVKWAINTSLTLRPVREAIEDESVHYCYVINNFFKAWGHQMVHNYSSLEKLAFQCGFKEVRSYQVGVSEETELRGIEMHGTIIPEDKNNLETMVLELIK